MIPTDLHLAEALGHDVSDKRIDLLRRIGAVGSISEAARGAGVSYKAAWQAIETLTNLAGTPLVEKVVGGSGGGGAQLTPAGHSLLQAHRLLHAARAQVLDALAVSGGAGGLPWAALGLRTSLRNQFPCRVQALELQGPFVRVQLALADGGQIGARITHESTELLGLQPGQPVLALCKAAAVRVAATLPAREGHNRLQGTVSRVEVFQGGAQIGLQLAAGVALVGFADPGHGLQVGDPATATVEEAGVVIALAGAG